MPRNYKYRSCYDNGYYNTLIYGEKAYPNENGHLFYGVIPLGFEVRKQLGHKYIYRRRHGNGYYGSYEHKIYQDKYKYFVPSSINNTEGASARQTLSRAVAAWQALSEEQKNEWRKKEKWHKGTTGYAMFISQYMFLNL